MLRVNPTTGIKGVHSELPALGNKYSHNFQNRFCGCGEIYDPHQEKGTMFQCLGLGTVEIGGCGEDWWHPECLVGLPRGWNDRLKESCTETARRAQANANTDVTREPAGEGEELSEEPPLPPGFPNEDDFETFICYKCVDSNPWLKRYAGTPGFLPAVYKQNISNCPNGKETTSEQSDNKPTLDESANIARKRKLEDDAREEPDSKRTREELPSHSCNNPEPTLSSSQSHKHDSLPAITAPGTFSLFLKEDFRDHLCHCSTCFPNLIPHPQLREEEETYEPPLSEEGDGANNGGGSHHTGSLLDRGEAALSNLDRVRAIEGVMVYNHLRDKVKEFLKPFAESGQAVSAEDIKAYFEKLRGDDQAIKEAGGRASALASAPAPGRKKDDGDDSRSDDGVDTSPSNTRKEQSGESSSNVPLLNVPFYFTIIWIKIRIRQTNHHCMFKPGY
jgi:E3 ubiquitin-protein ligase UBR7